MNFTKYGKSVYGKCCLGLIILAFILSKIDLQSSKTILSQIGIYNFLAVLCIYLIGQTISSCKWSLISAHIGFTCTFSEYLRFYFQGIFYNLFLPTGVGGDVIKGYFLYKHDKLRLKPDYAACSLLSDRVSGVLVLLMLLLIGNILHFKQLPVLINWILISGIVIISGFVILIVYISYKRILFKNKLINRILFFIRLYFDKAVLKIFTLSILFHLMLIAIHIIIGWDLNLKISWSYYLVLYPATAILSSLPVSLNGIGIREWAYIFFLGMAGINSSVAFVFALYWGFLMLTTGLIGSVFLLNWNKNEASAS